MKTPFAFLPIASPAIERLAAIHACFMLDPRGGQTGFAGHASSQGPNTRD